MSALQAKRLAVKYSYPPTLFLEYADSNQSTHVRAVKLKKLPDDINLDRLCDRVVRAFPRGLDPSTVNTQQVRSLLKQLIDCSCQEQQLSAAFGTTNSHHCGSSNTGRNLEHGSANGSHAPDSSQAAETPPGAVSSQTGALNCTGCCAQHHAEQQQQQQQQQQRAATCQHNCWQPLGNQAAAGGASTGCCQQQLQQQNQCSGATNRPHQQHLDMFSALPVTPKGLDGLLDGSGGSSVVHPPTVEQHLHQHQRLGRSGMDDSRRTGSTGSRENLLTSNYSNTSDAPTWQQVAHVGASGGGKDDNGDDDDGDRLVLEPLYLMDGEVDLNKVSDFELKMAKSHMNAHFAQNHVQPGDPAYVYDRQVDFTPTPAASGWDDDDDDG